MADYINDVQKLYVAYFSRPADADGLQFWSHILATDSTGYQQISHAFATSAEYKATYAGMDNRAVVNAIYEHLFGRAAESTGLDFWTNALNNGAMTVDNMVTQVAAGAQGSDLLAYNAKVAVSTSFTARLDQPNEVKAYSGDHANQIAIDFIATVKDLQSAASAMDPGVIDGVITHIVTDAGLAGTAPMAGLVGVAEPTTPPLYG
jgi:hypothetical protein